MENTFEEEMLFFFEEDKQQSNPSVFNTATSKEINEYVYCSNTKCCVCGTI